MAKKQYVLLLTVPSNDGMGNSTVALATGTHAALIGIGNKRVEQQEMVWSEYGWVRDKDEWGRICYWRNATEVQIDPDELFDGDFYSYTILEVRMDK